MPVKFSLEALCILMDTGIRLREVAGSSAKASHDRNPRWRDMVGYPFMCLTCEGSCRCMEGDVAASRTSTTLDWILMVLPELSTLEQPKSAGCRISASAARLGTQINEVLTKRQHRSKGPKGEMLHYAH